MGGVDCMYELALSLLNEYVEIYTYLTKNILYGEIVEVTPLEVVLQRTHLEKAKNQNKFLYIPISTIISIKKL